MAEDRVRGALLAGLTLAAVTLGGWWWRDSAPALGPTAAPAFGPTASPSPSTAAFLEPGIRMTGPQIAEVIPDPGDGFVIHEEPGRPAATSLSDTVWVDRSHLGAGDDPLVRQISSSPGQRHLLTVSCTGSGTLTISFAGADEDGPEPVPACSGSPVAVMLTASGGPLRVWFTVTEGELDLEARLAALY